jgi:hypothetical protein
MSICTVIIVINAANTLPSVNLNTTVLHNLTYALILHPIAAGVAFIAFLFGLIGVLAASRIATIFMGLFALIGSLVALVVFVIDMVLWNVLKNRLVEHDYDANLVSWVELSRVGCEQEREQERDSDSASASADGARVVGPNLESLHLRPG